MFSRFLYCTLLITAGALIISSCISAAPDNRYYYDETYRYDEPLRELSTTRNVINRVTLDAFDYLYPVDYTSQIPLRTINYGMNYLAPELFSYASGAARVDPSGEKDDLWLDSKRDKVQFAIYHFDKLAYGEMISRIEITGSPRFGQTRTSGIYIGMRQGTAQRYTWYGPYDQFSDWEIDFYPRTINSIGGGNPSLVVAVANGDDLKLSGIWVEVLDVEDLKYRLSERVYRLDRDRYTTTPLNYRCNNRTYTTGYYCSEHDWLAESHYINNMLDRIDREQLELKLERQRLREQELEAQLDALTPDQPLTNPIYTDSPAPVPQPPVVEEPEVTVPVLRTVPVI